MSTPNQFRWLFFLAATIVIPLTLYKAGYCLSEELNPIWRQSYRLLLQYSPVLSMGMLLQTLLSAFSLLSATTANGSILDLSYGSYAGVDLPSGITQFLGVRYANYPERFSASGPPVSFTGVRNATRYGPGCQGSGVLSQSNSEDCLFADIFAPTASLRTTGKVSLRNATGLPVYVFVQGGGLTNTLGRFNGTGLIQAGNLGFITVAFTYRAGPFGFLASKEIQQGGDLNNGLLDQVQLLRWVQNEIHVFGGDPKRVTLGGQSAGAGCVLSHLTAAGGIDQHLFQATLIQSPSSPPIRTIQQQQFQYDNLVNYTKCSGDTLACLRKRRTAQILAGSSVMPYPGNTGNPVFGWHIVIDGNYVTDWPHNAFSLGRYIHVPTMIGAVTDEGTAFTPSNIGNASRSMAFLKNNFPSLLPMQLEVYDAFYEFSVNSSNYWLKASTAYGETRYNCPGVFVSQSIPSWSFRYNIATPSQITSHQGAAHSSDLSAVWAPTYGSSEQIQLLKGQANQTTTWLQGYWSSFIQTFDPNTKRVAGSPFWYPTSVGERFLFNITNSRMEMTDINQIQRCTWVSSIASYLEQ